MLSGCSQLMWARSYAMWARGIGYFQLIRAGNSGCYRVQCFMFSVRYSYLVSVTFPSELCSRFIMGYPSSSALICNPNTEFCMTDFRYLEVPATIERE
jgi:hypothetical protein